MACSFTNSKGKLFFLHEKPTKNNGKIRWFSFKEAGAVDLPAGYVVVEGPTGLPICRKAGATGIGGTNG